MTETLYQHYLSHPKICTDTRKIEAGCIFFALKGDNFNGNKFAKQAFDAGAAFAVIDEEEFNTDLRCILVDDVLNAMQQLANHHRKQLNIPFIGITGSNGKTTTKEFIRDVLARKFNTQATVGNLNNHIGVPLTLLAIGPEVEIAVIEMGANHMGEIAELCAIAEPDFGIITNIGKAHLGEFGSFEGVIKAKKELYDHLDAKEGTVFLNRENELLRDLTDNFTNVVTYGTTADCFVTGELMEVNPFVKMIWQHNDQPENTVQTKIIGSYNVENILAAICIGTHFDVPAADINAAIESYQPENNRSQIVQTASNTVILDAYNANPTSMKAAIENFALLPGDNKFYILGDMRELGADSLEEHRKITELLRDKGLTDGVLVGAEFAHAATRGERCLPSNKDAEQFLQENPLMSHQILVKGSRGIRLETTKDYL